MDVLPAIKARGRPYLHIIYGFDYTSNAEIFEMLRKRDLSGKWHASRQQHDYANKMLQAFLNGKKLEQVKYVAAMVGYDEEGIDPTL